MQNRFSNLSNEVDKKRKKRKRTKVVMEAAHEVGGTIKGMKKTHKDAQKHDNYYKTG